jgi:DNA-binding transcriptional MerR regulator
MSSPSDLLKIGEFARLAETNLRTLRYYEEIGLLTPAARSAGGFRYYRCTDLNRVNMIRDLQELGLHLDRIRELITVREHTDDRQEFLERVRQALREHEELLDERMRAIEAQRAKIRFALDKTAECEDCVHTPDANNNYCEPCERTGTPRPQMLSALY